MLSLNATIHFHMHVLPPIDLLQTYIHQTLLSPPSLTCASSSSSAVGPHVMKAGLLLAVLLALMSFD